MMWLYENTKDNKARFVLGEKGKRPLVCFGVNPSTAAPECLDRTLTQVQRRSRQDGFDGWIMFNLYPQRATNPNNLHKELADEIYKTNLMKIKEVFFRYSKLTVWAAWGGLIQKRSYLQNCLVDIVKIVPGSTQWVHIGPLVDKKHPHHPLYLKKDLPFRRFDINEYLRNLRGVIGHGAS